MPTENELEQLSIVMKREFEKNFSQFKKKDNKLSTKSSLLANQYFMPLVSFAFLALIFVSLQSINQFVEFNFDYVEGKIVFIIILVIIILRNILDSLRTIHFCMEMDKFRKGNAEI